MLTLKDFTGINNMLPDNRHEENELAVATNVDIGRAGELRRRQGFELLAADCHKNLHERPDGVLLATTDGGDFMAITPSGAREYVYISLGPDRVWYCDLPDGRTVFSNGLIAGVTAGASAQALGVPTPWKAGVAEDMAGELPAGNYSYQLTYTRLTDGLEGGSLYVPPASIAGGLWLRDLPQRMGYRINVYLSTPAGDGAFYAGSTDGDEFKHTDAGPLALPLYTEGLRPPPIGTQMAFWRGRLLVAQGGTLYASRSGQWELFDLSHDFKQFAGAITMVQPVDGGIYVGTTTELAFLAGTEFDKLVYQQKLGEPVVLGSGVLVDGKYVAVGDGTAQGKAVICIAGGEVCVCLPEGTTITAGRYTTGATEVSATFRVHDHVPQYIAVPQ